MLTADSISGTLVAVGGGVVVLYGLWCAGRDRATKDAIRRYNDVLQWLDESHSENEKLRNECVRLRARVAASEASNAPDTAPP